MIDHEALEQAITAWFERQRDNHSGEWMRIPHIAYGINQSVQAVNVALIEMHKKGLIDKDARKKRRNAKVYPVYKMTFFTMPDGPHWFTPQAPKITKEQIRGITTVLGFTGDMTGKAMIQAAKMILDQE